MYRTKYFRSTIAYAGHSLEKLRFKVQYNSHPALSIHYSKEMWGPALKKGNENEKSISNRNHIFIHAPKRVLLYPELGEAQ